ncbi:MAG: hypothetical protein COW48_10340 [Hydrogenophilales bacterium CG17_big_fil_post_rev_8_21_14_2_50_63_12]|nr:MAG: hypothetical protein COW48_10340 [Hydrogenophilales bacterium CG17_big_fil_post_rev_8_21_14_2_50_63_12]
MAQARLAASWPTICLSSSWTISWGVIWVMAIDEKEGNRNRAVYQRASAISALWRYSGGSYISIEETTMTIRHALFLLAALLAGQAQASDRYTTKDIELYCVAVPTTELTAEAAKNYNVERTPNRGLLTITLVKMSKSGKSEAVAGQVYAGAINLHNNLSNIPIREVREGSSVYYLGEFLVSTPDTLRFLVNANVLGKTMKSEFAREFQSTQTALAQ